MFCFSWNNQNKSTWHILEKYFEKPRRLETTLPPFFWFLFMMRYHCILFSSSKNKYWKNTEKYTEKQFRLETTLPAVFLVPIHDLLSLHFILVQAKIGKYRKIPEQQYKQYPKNAVYARNHPPGHLAGGWFFAPQGFFLYLKMFQNVFLCFCQKAQGMFVLLLWISVQYCNRIWNILISNLLGKLRIHCEIALLRLLNVFVEAISIKFAIMIAPRIATYTISNSLFAFV